LTTHFHGISDKFDPGVYTIERLDDCAAQSRARRFGYQQSTLLQPETLAGAVAAPRRLEGA